MRRRAMAVAAALSVLAACGGGGDDGGDEASSETTATTEISVADETTSSTGLEDADAEIMDETANDVITLTGGNGYEIVAGKVDGGEWCAHLVDAPEGPNEPWDESKCVMSTGEVEADTIVYEREDKPNEDAELVWGFAAPGVDQVALEGEGEGGGASLSGEITAGIQPRDELDGVGVFAIIVRPTAPTPTRLVAKDADRNEIAAIDL
jgi:hypothetical protein